MASGATERLAQRVGLLRHAARLLEGEARRMAATRGEHVTADMVAETADGLDRWRRELERELHRKARRKRAGGRADPARDSTRESTMASKTQVTDAAEVAKTMAGEMDASLDEARNGSAPADQLAEHTAHRRAQLGRVEQQNRQAPEGSGA